MEEMSVNKSNRLELIDSIRGITIISMILYHACWIACYFGIFITENMMNSFEFYVWERTICMSFIFISGFVFSFSKKPIKNGLIVLGLGIAITIGSLIFVYDIRDIFGVLWLLGLAPLIMYLPDKFFKDYLKEKRGINYLLFIIFTVLFSLTYSLSWGFVGFGAFKLKLPVALYRGIFMTFLGFLEPGFYSVDYFPIFPWIFLYIMGYFAYKIINGTKFCTNILTIGIPGLKTIGKHSLIIYLVHPVVIFIIMLIISNVW